MSETKPPKKLAGVENADRFVTKPGDAYYHNGRTFDLRKIDTATAEALANDPTCRFLQWADPTKRPEGQRQPLPVPEKKTKPAELKEPEQQSASENKGKGK
jgi:hypothetical protein